MQLRHFVVIVTPALGQPRHWSRSHVPPSRAKDVFVSLGNRGDVPDWAYAPQATIADEPAAQAGADSREAIDRAADEYQLFLGADRVPLEMQKEPVLRWPNPTRETPEGATFVWTHAGRPEAIACIWDHGVLSHAFHSLSGTKLVAEHNGQVIWHPEAPGIEPAPLASAPAPADSAATNERPCSPLHVSLDGRRRW